MARGVNKVILVGNLGADPDTRYTQSGTAICTIKVATSEQWKDKTTNEKQERTEWHRVKLFGKLGEIAGEYLQKGQQVYIEGSIRTDKYTDKEGIERYATDIIASEMQMLSRRDASGGGESSAPPRERSAAREETPPRSASTGAPRSAPPPRESADDRFEDDDIPF